MSNENPRRGKKGHSTFNTIVNFAANAAFLAAAIKTGANVVEQIRDKRQPHDSNPLAGQTTPVITPTLTETPMAVIIASPTPQTVIESSYIDVGTAAGQEAVLNQATQGNAYTYDNATKKLIPPAGVTISPADEAHYVANVQNLIKGIKEKGQQVDLIIVHTNGQPGDANRSTYLAFDERGGKWSLKWTSVKVGEENILAVSPSEPNFPISGFDKAKVSFTDIPLPTGVDPNAVVVKWYGENQIVEAVAANGDMFVMDWRHGGEWIPMIDIPSTTLLNTSVLTNYLRVVYPDNTTAQNDALLKGVTESNSTIQQDANGLTYKVVKDANGIPLFVKYQTADGAWGEWQQSLETQKVTIDAVTPFINAQIQAGIQTSLIDVLKQGFSINEILGVDGKTYEIAVTHDGYPLMVKSEGGEWESIIGNLNTLNNSAGIKLGSQAVYYKLDDRTYKEILTGDFNTYLISGELNEPVLWAPPKASETDPYKKYATYNFERADKVIALAIANGADLHAGHLLDSRRPDFLPDWLLNGTFTKQEYIDILKAHVNEVMMHIGSQADVSKTTVSVVNEAFDWNKYDGFWAKAIGPEYVKTAYQQARESNKDIKLIYNDVNVFYNGQVDDHDRVVFKLVSDLKKDGLIDGVGFEMHLDASNVPSVNAVKQLIDMYSKIGVKVYITEFDVDMSKISGSDAEIQQKKAEVYVEMLKIFLNNPNIDSTTFFGFSKAVSWKPNTDSLMFDENYDPQMVFYEVAKLILSQGNSQIPQ